MKITVQIRASQLADPLRSALLQIHPSDVAARGAYRCELNSEDSRLLSIEHLLARHGYSRWTAERERDRKTEYGANYWREYDDSDLDAATYLEVSPSIRVGNLGTSPEGRVQLPGLDLDPEQVTMAHAFFRQIVLPDRWKRKLEGRELAGVIFYQAEVHPADTSDSDMVLRLGEEDVSPYDGEPWWELRSSIELPPVSPTMTLVDPDERPVEAGSRRWVFRREWPFNEAELHYRQTDVNAFPPFDLARTFEEWGGHPALVASKRFYHACREIGLKAGWVPVRIDEV